MSGPPLARRPRQLPTVETVLFSAVALAVIIGIAVHLPALPVTAQVATLGILVAVLGIPHGALDPLIARRAGIWVRPLGFALFNLGYIALIALVAGVWLLAPTASLVGFLLISGIHFGADWNAGRGIPLRALTGIGLLTIPAFSHHGEVAAVYATLAGPGGTVIAAVQAWLGPAALIALAVGAVLAVRKRPADALEIALATALALIAPPLVFFTVYFCALHSARHLRHGFAEERGMGRLAVGITAVYTIVPLAASAVLFLLFTAGAPADASAPVTTDVILRLVFIGLAALTVPHMALVAYAERLTPVRAGLIPVRR